MKTRFVLELEVGGGCKLLGVRGMGEGGRNGCRSPVQTLVPHPMTAYQLSPDLMNCLFARDQVLYFYRRDSNTPPVRIATLPDTRTGISLMATVTLSPSSNRVAYTQAVPGQHSWPDAYNLCIYDIATGQTTTVPSLFATSDPPLLAWTRDEAVLLASMDERDGAVLRQIRLVNNSAEVSDPPSRDGLSLCPNYGTFGTDFRSGYEITGNDSLPSANLYATARRALSSEYVTITRNRPWPDEKPGDTMITLDDNPGIRLLSFHRTYSDIAFLPSSLVLMADETFAALYLIDPQTRTLGKLLRGQTPIVLTPKYQMAAHLFAADTATGR